MPLRDTGCGSAILIIASHLAPVCIFITLDFRRALQENPGSVCEVALYLVMRFGDVTSWSKSITAVHGHGVLAGLFLDLQTAELAGDGVGGKQPLGVFEVDVSFCEGSFALVLDIYGGILFMRGLRWIGLGAGVGCV